MSKTETTTKSNNQERIIKTFPDGTDVLFETGKINQWRVRIRKKDEKGKAPRDEESLEQLVELAKRYGYEKVYSDCKGFYSMVDKTVRDDVLDYIEKKSLTYKKDDQIPVSILFTTLYATMIAEENKENTHLGKRIKYLAIHLVLCEGQYPVCAANFMFRMPWQKIDYMCTERGF